MSSPSTPSEKKCDPPIMSTKKKVMWGMEIPTVVLLVGIIISLVYFNKDHMGSNEMSTYAKAILIIAFLFACVFFGVFSYLFNKVKIFEDGCGF